MPERANRAATTADEVLLSDATIRLARRRVLKWGREHYKEFPWRKPAKLWHALIAEVLLQRTRAKNVVPVYHAFITHFPEPETLKTATLEEIERLIYPLGLRWRAPLLKKLCDYLAATGGRVPDTYEKLLELPAVGPYVAAAMVSLHCGKRAVLIDANVVRWLCRMVDRPMDGETRRDKWLIQLAEAMTPRPNVCEFNYAMLDFTMEICAKKPLCAQCPVGPKLCAHGRQVLGENPTTGHHLSSSVRGRVC